METKKYEPMFAQTVDNAGNPLAKNEIPIYTPIYSWMGEYIVREINKFEDAEELTIRLNTVGGEVLTGYAILSRLSDRKGKTNIFVDGMAYSMGAYMTLYANNVICSENARFMFHKAAYRSGYQPSEEEAQNLKDTNNTFKKKMQARLKNTPEAKELIKQVFEPDMRRDIYVDAKTAKKIGLVDEIRKLDSRVEAFMDEQAQLVAHYGKNEQIANEFEKITFQVETKQPESSKNVNINAKTKTMELTLEKLKAENPALYNEIFAKGEQSGVDKERDRVGSYLAFNDVAPEKVKEGIQSGNAMTETQRSEFALAMYAHKEEAKEGEEVPPTSKTPPPPKAGDDKAAEDAIDAQLKTDGLIK